MQESSPDLCFLAFSALEAHLRKSEIPAATRALAPRVSCPLFVTWHTLVGGEEELRGCIGNLRGLDIHDGVPEYAVIAATEDTRFSPITLKEFQRGELKVDVSLLVGFEPCGPLDWDVGTHGITINYDGYSAVFLPCVAEEQGWDQRTTLLHLLHKAGARVRAVTDEIVSATKCTRFRSSVAHMTYGEYRARCK